MRAQVIMLRMVTNLRIQELRCFEFTLQHKQRGNGL